MQAILTKYLSPTNTRGARIKATAHAGSVVVGYDHRMNVDGNHAAAAETLVRKLGWGPEEGKAYEGAWVRGQLPDGDYCHVLAADDGARGSESFRIKA